MLIQRIAMAVSLILILTGNKQLLGQVDSNLSGIQGMLSDRSGAVITGAAVSAVSISDGASWSTTTDRNGHFSLVKLPVGNLEIHVQQDGFAEQVRTVTTTPGLISDLPLTLSIAAIVQQINVTASPVNDGLDAGQIRESSARDLGEAAQDIAGVQKVRQAGIASTSLSAACFMTILPRHSTARGSMEPARIGADKRG